MPRSFRWMEPTFGPSQTSRHATPLHSATPSANQILQDHTPDNARRDIQRRKSGNPKDGPSPHARGPYCRHIAAGTLPRSSGCLLLVDTPARAAGEQLCQRRRAGHRDGVNRRCGTHGTNSGRHRVSAPKPASGKVATLPSLRHTNASAVSSTPRVPMYARPTASCGCRTRGSLGRAFLFPRWFTRGCLTHRPAMRSRLRRRRHGRHRQRHENAIWPPRPGAGLRKGDGGVGRGAPEARRPLTVQLEGDEKLEVGHADGLPVLPYDACALGPKIHGGG